MKRLIMICAGIAVLTASNVATADFYAATNEFGYQGTVWNITDGTGPWTTSTPRDGVLFLVDNAPSYWTNYNALQSNWSEHSPSNTNNSFFQLHEDGSASVTSATGSWDSTHTIFSVDVSGQNAPYPWSRFWQPDNGVAWGVTFTDYSYDFVATFSTPAVYSGGYWVNSVAPDTITGSFTGEFVVTYDVLKNPITDGDTYGFNIQFDKAWFAPLTSGTVYNEFGSVVPVPAAFILGVLGLSIAGVKLRKFV